MIFVDGQRIEPTAFPDGTSSLRFQPRFGTNLASFMFAYKPEYNIRWLYDNDAECMQLMYIVKHLKGIGECRIVLEMPYIPNARMDRVKNTDEVFTLKWFADFINSMGFASVKVLDPHSNVSPALFDRVEMMDVKRYIDRAIHCAKGDKQDFLLCYPDEGAAKRYSDMLGMEYVFCIKHRDWRTGKIENTELTSPEKVKGRDVLIVDDICSRGGTFTYTAKALKEAGAGNITLYVTHCENAIHNGSVLTDGLISHVFTTDSILRVSHEKITVMSTDVLNFAKSISKEEDECDHICISCEQRAICNGSTYTPE